MARKSINAIIGEKIRELRKEQGMSQMSLAALVGVSYQQIQKYEKASGSISVERLEQLSKASNFPSESSSRLKKAKQIKKSKKVVIIPVLSRSRSRDRALHVRLA